MEQLLKALHLTETAARLKGFTYRAGQKMRKYLKQIFRDIGIAGKETSLDGYEIELSIDSKDKTFYIVRTSSNGEEQAYAVPYEKPDIIGN